MRITSDSEKDTLEIGKKISRHLKPADILCLFGDLGAGKTVLAKGIAGGLGIKKKKIISPSFVLIREHRQGRLPLYHFDLYRLKEPIDIMNLGYEEYFYEKGITVIEWADRLTYLMPEEFLKIELSVKSKNRRQIKFCAFGRRYQELLRKIHDNIRH